MPWWCKAQLGTGTPAGNPSLAGPAAAERTGALRASKLEGAALPSVEPRDGAGADPPDAIDGDRTEVPGRADAARDDATGACDPGATPGLDATPGG